MEKGSGSVGAEDFGIGDADFDFTGRHGGIDGAFVAHDHLSIDADDCLFRESGNQIIDGGAWLDDELGDSVMIGKVDEVDPAVVAAIAQPAGEPDVGSGLRISKFAACMSPVPVHFASLVFFRADEKAGAWLACTLLFCARWGTDDPG